MGFPIKIRRRKWGSNSPINGYSDFTIVYDGSLPGAPYLFEPDPTTPNPNDKQFFFVFWTYYKNNENHVSISDELSPSISDIKPNSEATAWYMESGEGGQPAVSVRAFSMSQNQFINDNPISNVFKLDANNNQTQIPASWLGWPSGIPTSNQGIVVILKNSLNSEIFKEWQVLGGNWSTNSNKLIVPQGGWAIAAAFYGPSSIGPFEPRDPHEYNVPDWWWWLKKHIKDLRPEVDPSPEMIKFIHDKLSQWDSAFGKGTVMEGLDPIGGLISQIPKMDKIQRQAAQLKVKADMDRLKLADKMLKGPFREAGAIKTTSKKATAAKAPAKKEVVKKQAVKRTAVKKEAPRKAKVSVETAKKSVRKK